MRVYYLDPDEEANLLDLQGNDEINKKRN